MRPKFIIIAGAIGLVSVMLAGCVSTPKTKSDAPAIAVDRYSEMPLSQYQSRVMDEATKLSYACRMFRYLYGRWPVNINEIKSRTNGIDYDVFRGRATVRPTDNDSAEIAIFDGENIRSVQATPINFHLSDRAREQSQSAKFKIDVGAITSHGS